MNQNTVVNFSRSAAFLICLCGLLLAGGCKSETPTKPEPAKASTQAAATQKAEAPKASAAANVIRLATTTSTENSGLLGFLLPEFKKETGIEVQVLAMGSGKALKTAERGDCDVVLAHDRKLEDAFVASGVGIDRRDVMFNDFVILGPKADPAKLAGLTDAVEAFGRIAKSGAGFCSRGDASGTHEKEKDLWRAAGLTPKDAWYMELGQGMGETLITANQKLAYVLADRGTYIAFRKKIELQVLVSGDLRLKNPYGIIAVNPAKHPHAKYDDAKKLIDWITSPAGQKKIAEFKVDNEQLFFPWPAEATTKP